MILLGDKHRFTERELRELGSIFPSIDTVRYRDTDTQTVIDQIDALLAQSDKSTLVLNTAARIPDALLTHLVSLESHGIRYLSVESFLEKYLFKCYIPEDQINIDFLEDLKPLGLLQRSFKILIDYPAAVVLWLIYLVLSPYVSHKIRKQSPGDILYKQDRVGLGGAEFACTKFRSMQPDAEKDGAKFASEDDDRTFPWGETMRKYRIDEVPQFFNIFRGEMSLIGPRPERQHWVDQFEKQIPYYSTRHLVKPGITGWAQVMYPYGANAEDARQKLMYDLYYIKHWSPWLELKTIWKTVMVVLGKQGR